MSEHTPLTDTERRELRAALLPDFRRRPNERILAARTSTATADTGLRDLESVYAAVERVEALEADRDHWKAHAEEAGAGFTQVCRDYAQATARLAEYERLIHEPMDDAEFRRRIVQHYERRTLDATPASTEDRDDDEGTR